MPDQRLARGILDTSVVIDLEHIDPGTLPMEVAVTAITMAELATGPHATKDPAERARRQDRLQRAEAAFDALPFDSAAARAYGLIYSEVIAQGRKARGARAVDLLIAAVAAAQGTPLITRNPEDFSGLSSIVTIVEIARGRTCVGATATSFAASSPACLVAQRIPLLRVKHRSFQEG